MNVEVRKVDNNKGKGLFATKNIKSGEVIFEEDPLVCCQFAWNQSYGYRACQHCMRPLETAEENVRRLTFKSNLILPHPECCETDVSRIVECPACGEEYCSEDCRNLALSLYHGRLCLKTKQRDNVHPLEKLVDFWKALHFPPETCSIMLIARIFALVQQSSNKQELVQKFMNFCHRTENEDLSLVHKLVGEEFATHINMLRDLVSTAVPGEGVEHWLTPEGFRSLLALIGTNGQGVGSSAISVWVKNCSKLDLSVEERKKLDKFIDKMYEDLETEAGSFLNNEGSALYELQSASNHSCDPNAQANFLHNNYRLSMLAVKDIAAGEEIFISYLDECMLERSRHTRRKFLAENYLFDCNCNKCLSEIDQEDITSEEEMSSDDD